MHQSKYTQCIQACQACALACNHCAASCLKETDVQMMSRCIALDIDCAQICDLAAAAMARDSECAKTLCEACARICKECGVECSKHSTSHCADCAKACHQCAQECISMAQAG